MTALEEKILRQLQQAERSVSVSAIATGVGVNLVQARQAVEALWNNGRVDRDTRGRYAFPGMTTTEEQGNEEAREAVLRELRRDEAPIDRLALAELPGQSFEASLDAIKSLRKEGRVRIDLQDRVTLVRATGSRDDETGLPPDHVRALRLIRETPGQPGPFYRDHVGVTPERWGKIHMRLREKGLICKQGRKKDTTWWPTDELPPLNPATGARCSFSTDELDASIVDAIRDNPGLPGIAYRDALELKVRTWEAATKRLRRRGLLRTEGRGTGTRWFVEATTERPTPTITQAPREVNAQRETIGLKDAVEACLDRLGIPESKSVEVRLSHLEGYVKGLRER